jgi:Pin2-interacting protein X1
LFLIIIPIFSPSSEVAAVESDSPDITPKKDKSAKHEVTKVTRPQGRLVWT